MSAALEIVGALLEVDALEVGADLAHHDLARGEQELGHAHHAGHAAQLVLDVVGLGRVDVDVAVGDHDQVRVQRQHLVLELALEAAGDRQHDDQRRHAQHDPHRRYRREDRELQQQHRQHGVEAAHERRDDADGLPAARRPVLARDEEQRQAGAGHRQRDGQIHERAPGPPAAVQVALAHEPLQPRPEELSQAKSKEAADRQRDERASPAGDREGAARRERWNQQQNQPSHPANRDAEQAIIGRAVHSPRSYGRDGGRSNAFHVS